MDGHLKGRQSKENTFVEEKVVIFAGLMGRNQSHENLKTFFKKGFDGVPREER